MEFNGSLCVLNFFASLCVLISPDRSVFVIVGLYGASIILMCSYGSYRSFYKSFNILIGFYKSLCIFIDFKLVFTGHYRSLFVPMDFNES